MRTVRGRVAAGLALAFAAGPMQGCGSPPARVSVEGVRVGQPEGVEGAEGVVVHFDLLVRNPSRSDYPLSSVRYVVRADGREVFRGVRSAEATAPARSERRMTLPAALTGADAAAAQGAELSIVGELTYLTPGALAEALFDAGLRQPTVSFSGRAPAAAEPAPEPAAAQEPGAESDSPEDDPR